MEIKDLILPFVGALLSGLCTYHLLYIYDTIKKGICPKCGGKIKRGWSFNLLTRYTCSNRYESEHKCDFELDYIFALFADIAELVAEKRHNTTFK